MQPLKPPCVLAAECYGRRHVLCVCVCVPPPLQDFVVGKEYKCVVQLTNISYTVNTCKLLGVSDNLKDFLSVK